jgi:hypothetical protein
MRIICIVSVVRVSSNQQIGEFSTTNNRQLFEWDHNSVPQTTSPLLLCIMQTRLETREQ